MDDIHVNGKLTLGEDVADLGGLILAYRAWVKETSGKTLTDKDGLTPAQRFFVGYGQSWCANSRPETLRLRAVDRPALPGAVSDQRRGEQHAGVPGGVLLQVRPADGQGTGLQGLVRRARRTETYTQMLLRRVACLALVLCSSRPVDAQDQQPKNQIGWPCSGKVDPSFIRTAEATGGKVLLFTPNEITGAADDMAASSGHRETVFRAGGQLADGVHDFEIPLDSTIESAYFFVALQCQQFVAVLQPSGDELRADGPGVDYHAFEAVRLVTIKAPSPGTWRVRMAGRGFFSVIVTAKTTLALTAVSLAENGVPTQGTGAPGQTSAARDLHERSAASSGLSLHLDAWDSARDRRAQAGAGDSDAQNVRGRSHAARNGVSTLDDRN